jgi:hypothetical protein
MDWTVYTDMYCMQGIAVSKIKLRDWLAHECSVKSPGKPRPHEIFDHASTLLHMHVCETVFNLST